MNGHETKTQTISYAKRMMRGLIQERNATIGKTTPRINT
jgi:hypothetical protein